MNGIQAITRIRADYPQSRFIVLTSFAGDVQAIRAFQASATGYLLKKLLRTELNDTIRLLHAGKRMMPPAIANQSAEHTTEDTITSRELEVLRGVPAVKPTKSLLTI